MLSVVASGIISDGTVDVQPYIQSAIDSINAGGGGTLVVPPGTYRLDSSLAARSNVEIHLQQGAFLQKHFSSDTNLANALIRNADTTFATKLTNFAITGPGKIGCPPNDFTKAGIILALWGDDMRLSDFTVDTYGGSDGTNSGGQAIVFRGHRN